jgi:hypothetical protein
MDDAPFFAAAAFFAAAFAILLRENAKDLFYTG